MNNTPPIREPAGDRWSPSWTNWFQQIFQCLKWTNSFNTTATIDFLSIAGAAQATSIVPLAGVRLGDAVQVTPYADVAGLLFSGVVTANDAVSVYAKNVTGAVINPPLTKFRLIVLQN